MAEIVRFYRTRPSHGPGGSTTPYENLVARDTFYSRALNTSPWDTCPLEAAKDPYLMTLVYDDCFNLNTTKTNDLWQVVKGTGGTLAVASTAGGWINIPTAASQNDYQVLASQATSWLLKANKPIWFEVGMSCTEANTNAASWFLGLASTTTTGFISNAGAPPASYSGVVFYKATGGMSVNFQTSNGSTQNTTSGLFTAVSGTNYLLGAYLDPYDGTTGQVTPYVSSVTNGVVSSVVVGTPVNLALGSLAGMYFLFGVKAGSGSAETLAVDVVQVAAFR